MDLKLGQNSHESARKTACTQQRENLLETREAGIRHRQEQKNAMDIAVTEDSLLYGPRRDDSV